MSRYDNYMRGLVAIVCFSCLAVHSRAGLNNVYWTPAEATNVVAWFDAADFSTITTNTSGEVTGWAQKSVNTNASDAVNGYSGTGNAIYRASDAMAGGMATIGNDAIDDANGVYFTSDTYDAVFVVLYYKDGLDSTFDGRSGIFSGPSGSAGQHRVTGDAGTDEINTTTVPFTTAGGYRNGSSSVSKVILPMPLSLFRFEASGLRNSRTHLGYIRGSESFSANSSWFGGYGEYVFAAGASLEEKQTIEGYLAWKWDLEGELPPDHPYKDKAPNAPPAGTVLLVR